MSAYRTYITGRNTLFYDKELIESLKFWRVYRSIWRVLHIDGFEPDSYLDARPFSYKFSMRPVQQRIIFNYPEDTDEKSSIMTQDELDEYALLWDGKTAYSLQKIDGVRTWVPDPEMTKKLIELNYGFRPSQSRDLNFPMKPEDFNFKGTEEIK